MQKKRTTNEHELKKQKQQTTKYAKERENGFFEKVISFQ